MCGPVYAHREPRGERQVFFFSISLFLVPFMWLSYWICSQGLAKLTSRQAPAILLPPPLHPQHCWYGSERGFRSLLKLSRLTCGPISLAPSYWLLVLSLAMDVTLFSGIWFTDIFLWAFELSCPPSSMDSTFWLCCAPLCLFFLVLLMLLGLHLSSRPEIRLQELSAAALRFNSVTHIVSVYGASQGPNFRPQWVILS